MIQTKTDAQDGEMKLVEVNARLGNIARVLFRMEPALDQLAVDWLSGASEVPYMEPRVGQCGVSLLDDLATPLLWVVHRLGRKSSADNVAPSLRSLVQSFRHVYGRRPAVDDYVRSIVRDPFFVLGFAATTARREYRLPANWSRALPWGGVRHATPDG